MMTKLLILPTGYLATAFAVFLMRLASHVFGFDPIDWRIYWENSKAEFVIFVIVCVLALIICVCIAPFIGRPKQ